MKNALRRAQRHELRVERALGDGDDLVDPVHLRALHGLARRVPARVRELERPPAAVGVLVRGRGELGRHRLPARVAGVDDVVAGALEDVQVFVGEELDGEPPGLVREVVVVVEPGELGCEVVVSSAWIAGTLELFTLTLNEWMDAYGTGRA